MPSTEPRPIPSVRFSCRAEKLHEALRGFALLLIVAIVLGALDPSPSLGQGSKKKTAKGTPKTDTVEMAEEELPSLSFDAAGSPLTDQTRQNALDPDETAEGRTRLGEIIGRAKEVYKERKKVEDKRRPYALQRDAILAEVLQLQNVMADAARTRAQAGQQAASVQRQLMGANVASQRERLNASLQNLRQVIANTETVINTNSAEIARREPALTSLNTSIAPLDAELRKLWEELNACRQQWLEIRVPHDKYARTDFEGLKRVIDDWLLIDGLWPEAYCWAALCEYELEEFERAAELAEKAGKMRTEIVRSRKPWPQWEALQGLVALKTPGQRGKSNGWIQKAISHADKEKDWDAYFIAARALVENAAYATRAKAYLERALEMKPSSLCVKYQLAVLQTTSTHQQVRDVPAGTKLLEGLWSRTGERSWRISGALARAYDAGDRKSDGERLWSKTRELAPPDEYSRFIGEDSGT